MVGKRWASRLRDSLEICSEMGPPEGATGQAEFSCRSDVIVNKKIVVTSNRSQNGVQN